MKDTTSQSECARPRLFPEWQEKVGLLFHVVALICLGCMTILIVGVAGVDWRTTISLVRLMPLTTWFLIWTFLDGRFGGSHDLVDDDSAAGYRVGPMWNYTHIYYRPDHNFPPGQLMSPFDIAVY